MSTYTSVIDSVVLNRPWYSRVENGVYDIPKRLREIDRGYFVLYNHRSKKFEVHNTSTFPHTYSFLVPFDELDARTLEYCRKTMKENTDKLLKEIEEHNRRLDKEKQRKLNSDIEDASYQTADDLCRAIDEDELHKGYKHIFGGVNIDK